MRAVLDVGLLFAVAIGIVACLMWLVRAVW
jgi:hypothetical protein